MIWLFFFNVRGELYMQYIVFDTDSCSVCGGMKFLIYDRGFQIVVYGQRVGLLAF